MVALAVQLGLLTVPKPSRKRLFPFKVCEWLRGTCLLVDGTDRYRQALFLIKAGRKTEGGRCVYDKRIYRQAVESLEKALNRYNRVSPHSGNLYFEALENVSFAACLKVQCESIIKNAPAKQESP
ncbi:MAG: hypothetical protein N3E51_00920 [Candidatus Micrarchaeota archaeon]|nr:hypothetical protein [Candidatus Micrarchaeota archaeon]